MLEGTDFVSHLITQYTVIERLYAREGSELSAALMERSKSELTTELRDSLLSLYVLVIQYQIHAIEYFDSKKKFWRAFAGLNFVTAANIKDSRKAVNDAMGTVDRNAALVHQYATMHGIDGLLAGQDELLAGQKDLKAGIMSLAKGTNSAMVQQRAILDERLGEITKIAQQWQRPVVTLATKMQEDREIAELMNIRQWLSTAHPEDNHVEAKNKRSMLLGGWLLKHHKFEDWKRSPTSSFMWLYGFPGTGKTSLLGRVIDHLRDDPSNSLKTSRVAFFYFSNDKSGTGRENVSSRSDPKDALRSIVSQLSTAKQGRNVAPVVRQKYIDCGPGSDKERTLDYSDCVTILVAISSEIPVTIVFDAFDECDHSQCLRLLGHLKHITEQSPRNVKIFISTRSFPGIDKELTPNQSLEVTSDNNGDDVRTFIKMTLQDRIENKELLNGSVSDALKKEIEDTLTNRANNMFLYASLLLNRLCDQTHQDDEGSIRKKLGELPRNLGEVYDRIMAEVHDDKNNSQRSCEIARATFKWLLRAQEPLTHDQLLEAISPSDKKADLDEVSRACRTLVVKGKTGFEFAHYSVREHISKMDEYSASQCHLVATQSCLRILNTSFGPESSRLELSEAQKAFNQYALLYWPLHYEGIEFDDMDQRIEAIKLMLRNYLLKGRVKTDKFATWFARARDMAQGLKDNKYLSSKLNSVQASPLTPLFAACVFGFADIIGKFGRDLDGLNKRNSHGQSALCLAIENNKLDVVKALLSRRFPAEINLLNVGAVEQFETYDAESPPTMVLYASALQAAAVNGVVDIAEYLISEGAHIDLVAGYYGSALQAAALKGHASIVSLLLSKGAEPNSQGGFHGNALQAAAAGGNANIINLLLENKPPALVNVPSGHYGSAIMAAVCSGSSDAVWTLLEEGANPNALSKSHGLPLEKAVSTGAAHASHKEIVSLLIESGAQADTTPIGENGPLHMLHHAALHDMPNLAEYCLKDPRCNIDMITYAGPRYFDRYFHDGPPKRTPLFAST